MRLVKVVSTVPALSIDLPEWNVTSDVSNFKTSVGTSPISTGFKSDTLSGTQKQPMIFRHTGEYRLASSAAAYAQLLEWESIQSTFLVLHRGHEAFQGAVTLTETIDCYISSFRMTSPVQRHSTLYKMSIAVEFKSTDPDGWT